jgi:membrane protease YdiL (CAAX protease family)
MNRQFILFVSIYGSGSLILLLLIPVVAILIPLDGLNSGGEDVMSSILTFEFDLTVLLVTMAFLIVIVLYDWFFIGDIERAAVNMEAVMVLIGGSGRPVRPLIAAILSGLFEELLFRGYLLLLPLTMLPRVLPVQLAWFCVSSLLFGILHSRQGWRAFTASTIIAVVFGWGCLRSGTIWYAVIGHFLFNLVELVIVFPRHAKIIKKDRSL